MEILQAMLTSVVITFWNYDWCWQDDGRHYIRIENFEVIEARIEICDWLERDKLLFTLIHELWHQYWFYAMSLYERELYEDIYERSWENDFYRDYSQNSLKEDFADMFAEFYIWNTPRDWVYKEKLEFIESSIKSLKNR